MTDRIPSELRTPVDGLPSSSGRTTASRRKKSTAPASRALTAGLSLAATAAIVAALALTGQQSATSAAPTVELDMASGSKLNGFADQVAGASDQAAVPAPGISPAESSAGTRSVPVGSPPPAQPMQVVASASTQSTAASSTASPSPTVTAPPVTAAPATTVPPAPVTTVAPAPRTRAS